MLRLVAALLVASARAGENCTFADDAFKYVTGGQMSSTEYMWEGSQLCGELRCDASTEVLWVSQNYRSAVTRSSQNKDHTLEYRSRCLVLAPDGRYARYARWRELLRSEGFLFKRREFVHFKDVGPKDASDFLAQDSFGRKQYEGCLEQCATTCAELALRHADEAFMFSQLEAGLLDQVPSSDVCFNKGVDKQVYGWVTGVQTFYFCLFAVLLFVPCLIGCCVSQRACYAYSALNKFRNEFDDACPCLAKFVQMFITNAYGTCASCLQRCCANCCACGKGDCKSVAPEPRETVVDGVVTQQPAPDNEVVETVGSAFLEKSLNLKARQSFVQFRLLLWKIYKVKSRDRSGVIKQILLPACLFVVVWLLYVVAGLTGFVPQSRWSPSNANFKRKNGKLRDYDRGQVLSHGTLETYVAQAAFVPFMQVVIVGLVVEQQTKLFEAMKMSGLKPWIYWVSNFFADGVVVGFCTSAVMSAVAAPGLFNVAGHAASPFGTLLALHWVYIFSLVSICFAAAAVISQAQTAAMFSLFIQVATIALYLVGAIIEEKSAAVWEVSVPMQRVWALVPQFAYGLMIDGFLSHRSVNCRLATPALAWEGAKFGCRKGDAWEDASEKNILAQQTFAMAQGATCSQFANSTSAPSVDCALKTFSEYPHFYTDTEPWRGSGPRPRAGWTGALYGMLFLDVLLYMLLAWYLQQVIPWSEFGTPKAWYFPFLPSYWLPSLFKKPNVVVQVETVEIEAGSSPDIEVRHVDAVVEIRNLRKAFGEFVAVDGIDLNIAESEIFCLLGHNGAGKTTTISMLSGLLPPDGAADDFEQGAAHRTTNKTVANIYGLDILTAAGMDGLRRTLGVCPQHDILFAKLTLEEHLYFFSRLKGKSQAHATADAAKLLDVFHLSERAHHLGAELSGGQRRKLSTSIALSGASRFIVLDEPTAGMDPVARRELWTLLRAVRKGRALLLTTHHMDEAEALGDRIAIMASGRVQAEGSVSFLKQRFGSGYRLDVEFETMDNLEAKIHVLDETVSQHVPRSTPASDVALASSALQNLKTMSYVLPFDSAPNFGILFDAVDALGGVRMHLIPSTLEDVFLKVGEHDLVQQQSVLEGELHDDGGAAARGKGEIQEAHKVPIFWKQFAAIVELRLALACNDLVVVLLPLRLLESFGAHAYSSLTCRRATFRPILHRLGPHVGGARATAVAIIPGLVAVIMGIVAGEDLLATGDQPKWGLPPNAIIAVALAGSYLVIPGLLAEPLVRERVGRLRNLLGISGLDTRAYWLGTMAGDMVLLTVSVMVTWSALAASKVAFLKESFEYRSEFVNATQLSGNYTATQGGGGGDDEFLNFACTFVRGLCTSKSQRKEWLFHTPWVFVLYPFFMLSLSAFSHAGSFSFTEPTMCVGAFPVGAICLILLPLIIVLFLAILFGGLVAGNEAAQLFSWNFLEILGAFGWLGAFASPVGCLLMTLLKVANLSFIPKKGLDESLSPTWPPFWALLLILIAQTVVFESVAYLKDRVDSRPLEFTPSKFPRQRAARLDRDVLAERDRVLQMLHAAGEQDQGDEANLLTGAKTFKAFGASIAKKASHLKTAILDSVAEDSRPPILRGDVADADEAGLAVFQLRKIYLPLRFGGKAVEAVQNVTFGVRLGECFGLLGANGAGKTTTMSMVMRATEPTSGDAKVGGFSVLTEFSKAASALGVVNQHNTLWETLSCAAHLRAFAKLRGLEGSAVEAAVRDTLRRVELEPHSHKLARALSGGMKRKLCCAAALIGDPSVVLLDEPSAGLDPVSQRNLWNLLKSTMAGRAVVLTTHSMLEADVLCHRIGIMVRGQLSCLGTPAHLKARYASGSELVCKLASVDEKHGEDAISKLEHFVAHEFQGATLASADADVVTFEIPQSKKSLLGQTFAVFDQHVCDELGVAEFALLPASIEKVFIRIVATDAGRGDAKGRALAAELQQLESDDLEDELGHLLFTEKTCCGLSRYAHLMLAKYNACASCTCCCYLALAILGAPWPACAAGAYCCLAALFAAMGSCASFTCCLQKPKTDE